ncbi:hypothetical protein FGG51_gp006 [Mycobacterium phage Astro]|uniref:Uncharacterized protein n=3 Tax=Fromanvirus astro TaxID=1195075 RepID=I6R1Q5_9CAUD|nr:hypothetical protein AVT31_gp006 [Mycobacterium phage Smeadley]YP_009638558.1 hypothetical protein FGG51_gp006 [Mycobacterium phage Astro]AXQ63606.1 hypothetical protein SEA_DIXON_100 [Mycobacterium phage Dixon]AYD87031.1 membrane protein [Mycobacterium phage NearlyHeadless]QBI96691.1 hypothetical protein SEA_EXPELLIARMUS_96 [Mycobacterium phage Expelliarmus]QDH93045.1 hypothetical protein SEA_STEPHIG9_102 [Mycobacterium phage Stephig9]QHB36992.1 hypothetical protein SEA_ROARY_101 [Mycobac
MSTSARLKMSLARIMVAGTAIAAMTFTGHGVPDTDSTRIKGDDNGDGYVMEDESGWDCATMGNLICGPKA